MYHSWYFIGKVGQSIISVIVARLGRESTNSNSVMEETVHDRTCACTDWYLCVLCRKHISGKYDKNAHKSDEIHKWRVFQCKTLPSLLYLHKKYIFKIPKSSHDTVTCVFDRPSKQQMEYPVEYMPTREEIAELQYRYSQSNIAHTASTAPTDNTNIITSQEYSLIETVRNARTSGAPYVVVRICDMRAYIPSRATAGAIFNDTVPETEKISLPITEPILHVENAPPLSSTYKDLSFYRRYGIGNNNNTSRKDGSELVITDADYMRHDDEAALLDEVLMKRILEESAEEHSQAHSQAQIRSEVESEQEKIRKHYEESLQKTSHIVIDDEIDINGNFDDSSDGDACNDAGSYDNDSPSP